MDWIVLQYIYTSRNSKYHHFSLVSFHFSLKLQEGEVFYSGKPFSDCPAVGIQCQLGITYSLPPVNPFDTKYIFLEFVQ